MFYHQSAVLSSVGGLLMNITAFEVCCCSAVPCTATQTRLLEHLCPIYSRIVSLRVFLNDYRHSEPSKKHLKFWCNPSESGFVFVLIDEDHY